jgi:hypothetical protein
MTTELEAMKALLWEEWDPIGVNDDADAFGEYDSYALQLQVMLGRGADVEEVARHLSWVAKTLMGLSSTNDQHSMAIARKVIAIHSDNRFT